MPSVFEQRLTAGPLSRLYAQFGVAATYKAKDGTSITGTVRVQPESTHELVKSDIVQERQSGLILARQSEFTAPQAGGRFILDSGEVWTIEVTPKLNHGQHECQCVREGNTGVMTRRASNG